MQVEQLSILEPTFDEARAHWFQLNGKLFCDIIAHIPKEARPPEETALRNKQSDFQYELWEHLTLSIYRKYGCTWEEAMKLLTHCRETGDSVGMRVDESIKEYLRCVEVVEYLKGGEYGLSNL